MEEVIDIFCDESCHLKNDNSNIMVLGAVFCPKNQRTNICNDIRDIKRKHKIGIDNEIKWTKVSESKVEFYKELTQYFFNNSCLSYRSIIITNKDKINNDKYNDGDDNLLYYKMYYYLLTGIINNIDNKYRIFLDTQNAKQMNRVEKLKEVLCNNKYDFMKDSILNIWQINSKSSELVQLADFFSGALAFYHRKLYYNVQNSNAKKAVIDIIHNNIGNSLTRGTPREEKHFNIFLFKLREE